MPFQKHPSIPFHIIRTMRWPVNFGTLNASVPILDRHILLLPSCNYITRSLTIYSSICLNQLHPFLLLVLPILSFLLIITHYHWCSDWYPGPYSCTKILSFSRLVVGTLTFLRITSPWCDIIRLLLWSASTLLTLARSFLFSLPIKADNSTLMGWWLTFGQYFRPFHF